MAYHASERLPRAESRFDGPDPGAGLGLKLFALFAGLALGAMVPFVIWLADSAQNARNDANAAAAKASAAQSSSATMPGMPSRSSVAGGTYATPSFAGLAPANADALAMAHAAVPAELPAAPAGPVADVTLPIQHGIQTAVVPAGGGGVFDVTIPKAGIYPFVTHSFASVALGEVGLLKVGHVAGTMSH